MTDACATSQSLSAASRRACRYRPRPFYLLVGAVGLVFSAVMGVGSVVAAYRNLDGSFPDPKAAAVIFGVFWSGFAAMSVWILAACLRERLRLGPSAVTQRGIFRVRRLRVRDLERLVWRSVPVGGSVVLRSSGRRLKIELANFTRPEREEIVAYFRRTVPLVRHEGWEEFTAAAKPRKASRSASSVPILVLSAFAACFVIAGLRRGEFGHILLGAVNAAAAVGLGFLWRGRGPSPRPDHSPSASPQASDRASSAASGSSKPGSSGVA